MGGRQHTPCVYRRGGEGEGILGRGYIWGDGVCVYGGKIGEGGRRYIGGDGVCVYEHLHKVLS